jgi:predicted MFS family arabinose efflux permease
MVPLESEFGWSNASISVAVAINIALFGLIGPFAASWMEHLGIRKIVLYALALLAVSVASTSRMHTRWQLILLWGICVGSGTGVTAMVLAAVVAGRWFETHRGLVLGILSAGNATGQLLFLPMLASVADRYGWRSVSLLVASTAVVMFVVVLFFLRDKPADLGLLPFGQIEPQQKIDAPPLRPMAALNVAKRSSAFWVLAGSFFVCGASTSGLVGTHLIPACHDYGISEVHAAGLLAMMGLFDVLGTTLSGWLTDKFQSRYLLLCYYLLRGISLMFLPHVLAHDQRHLSWFAVFYGLDWVATVPPTVKLATDCFGRQNAGVIYGWIGAAHQLGASLAAAGAGAIRTYTGHYQSAFWISGAVCSLTGLAFLFTSKPLTGKTIGDSPDVEFKQRDDGLLAV